MEGVGNINVAQADVIQLFLDIIMVSRNQLIWVILTPVRSDVAAHHIIGIIKAFHNFYIGFLNNRFLFKV